MRISIDTSRIFEIIDAKRRKRCKSTHMSIEETMWRRKKIKIDVRSFNEDYILFHICIYLFNTLD